jgi:autonomous glycyl radical cofactor GrcA
MIFSMVSVVFEARQHLTWKTLKRRCDAECNHYPHTYPYLRLKLPIFHVYFD